MLWIPISRDNKSGVCGINSLLPTFPSAESTLWPKAFCHTPFLWEVPKGVHLLHFTLCWLHIHRAFACGLQCLPITCLCSLSSWAAICNFGHFQQYFFVYINACFSLQVSFKLCSCGITFFLLQLCSVPVSLLIFSLYSLLKLSILFVHLLTSIHFIHMVLFHIVLILVCIFHWVTYFKYKPKIKSYMIQNFILVVYFMCEKQYKIASIWRRYHLVCLQLFLIPFGSCNLNKPNSHIIFMRNITWIETLFLWFLH